MKPYRAKDRISACEATVWIIIDGVMHEALYVKSFEAKVEKNKVPVRCIGSRIQGHKTVGINCTGTMTADYVTPYFRNALNQYKRTGTEPVIDIVVSNDDPESSAGVNTYKLFGVNFDSTFLFKSSSKEEALEEEYPFTFEDWECLSKFKEM